jgi:dCTP deaminase
MGSNNSRRSLENTVGQGVLSKIDIIERIMIGELFIVDPDNEKQKENIINCLKLFEDCRNTKTYEKIEELFKKYFEELALNEEKVLKRREKIIKLAKELTEKSSDKIIEFLESKNDYFKKLKKKVYPILVDDLDPDLLQGANYDIRLGECTYLSSEKAPRKLTLSGANSVAIEPGEYGILMSKEYFYFPIDLMGLISIRLTYKQRGLVNISAFHVEPGFYGRLMFTVFNAAPNNIVLRYKEPVFMVIFLILSKPVPKVKKSRWHGMIDIPIESIMSVQGTPASVRGLDKRVRQLEIMFRIFIGVISAVLASYIIWILTYLKS